MSDLPDSTPIFEDAPKKRGGGRPRKVDLVGTLHEAFKPYQDFYADMSPIEICLMGAVRVAPRYESVQRVLKLWDEIPKRDRRRITILDEKVKAAGLDLDEFKGLCKIGVNSALKEESDTMIATAEPRNGQRGCSQWVDTCRRRDRRPISMLLRSITQNP